MDCNTYAVVSLCRQQQQYQILLYIKCMHLSVIWSYEQAITSMLGISQQLLPKVGTLNQLCMLIGGILYCYYDQPTLSSFSSSTPSFSSLLCLGLLVSILTPSLTHWLIWL